MPLPGIDGYCCGRYASYWNAFLLVFFWTQQSFEICFTCGYTFHSMFCFAIQIVCKILKGASKSTSETVPHGSLVFEVNKPMTCISSLSV